MLGTKIVTPAKKPFHKLFHTSAGHNRKVLQIISRSQKHNIIEDRYLFSIEIDLSNPKKRIKLIYYTYHNVASYWKVIVSGQLQQLKSLGILNEVDLYIHITDITAVFDNVIRLIKAIHNNVSISTSAGNHFEYPAIRLIHDLAIEDPESIYIYLHSKGMSYNKGVHNEQEKVLLTMTFEDWRRKLENFKSERILN
jgi:hypothetical protein